MALETRQSPLAVTIHVSESGEHPMGRVLQISRDTPLASRVSRSRQAAAFLHQRVGTELSRSGEFVPPSGSASRPANWSDRIAPEKLGCGTRWANHPFAYKSSATPSRRP